MPVLDVADVTFSWPVGVSDSQHEGPVSAFFHTRKRLSVEYNELWYSLFTLIEYTPARAQWHLACSDKSSGKA